MRTILIVSMILAVWTVNAQHEMPDIKPLRQAINNWYEAWDTKDVELAVKDYGWDCDWTNAFGDRVRGKDELRALLTRIFAMDFVMAGESENTFDDFTFLTDDIAYVRSQTVRKGQKQRDGTLMDDRLVNHLRIFWRLDDEWQIVSHLISQALPKK